MTSRQPSNLLKVSLSSKPGAFEASVSVGSADERPEQVHSDHVSETRDVDGYPCSWNDSQPPNQLSPELGEVPVSWNSRRRGKLNDLFLAAVTSWHEYSGNTSLTIQFVTDGRLRLFRPNHRAVSPGPYIGRDRGGVSRIRSLCCVRYVSHDYGA